MGLYNDALVFFRKAPSSTCVEAIIAEATCRFHKGETQTTITLLTGIEDSQFISTLQAAECWKLLAICMGLEKNQTKKELYATKALNAYLELRWETVRYYASLRKTQE
jgi:hypothetical protein